MSSKPALQQQPQQQHHPHQQGRKMRRNRSTSSGGGMTTSSLSGFELYETQGNAIAAWDSLYRDDDNNKSNNKLDESNSTMVYKYNRLILRSLTCPTKDDDVTLLKELESFHNNNNMESLTARKRKRNELIMAYNRALVLYTTGNFAASVKLCEEYLRPMMMMMTTTTTTQSAPLPMEITKVASRMAMIWLEVLLAVGNNPKSGINASTSKSVSSVKEEEKQNSSDGSNPTTADVILNWLESLGLELKSAQFKFLLSLYKGRVDLAARNSAGIHEESRLRSARKELKIAMEVFQHKLRTSNNADTVSITSSVDSNKEQQLNVTHNNNKETFAATSTTTTHALEQQQQQSPPLPHQSIVLQKLNQSALNLKASLEQLKGNVKKSLILCQEAHFDSSYYNAIHANNLAVVYQTSHKRHLALHVLSKALQQQQDTHWRFCHDGTAAPLLSFYMVWNAALCALQARNYKASYECWARCLANPIFDLGITWLRLAESCLGMFQERQNKRGDSEPYFPTTPIQVNGQVKGLVIRRAPSIDTSVDGLPPLGSAQDLEWVSFQPLKRARFALDRVLSDSKIDHETRQTARLALAYVSLWSREYEQALKLSLAVLDAEEKALPRDVTNSVAAGHALRRCATARMYAAEGFCGLGDAVQAMKYLVGPYGQDGKTLDRLAADLGGVTLERAATSSNGKRRLARAQTLVRSSASVVTAAVGNIKAAKQLAMLAQAMEDSVSNNANGDSLTCHSYARRALIYCLLRGGNSSSVLSLLQSSRHRLPNKQN